MYTLKTEAVIIKRRNVGEADKLITAFTRYNGKMQLKAPGIRKISSRRSSHLELLNRSNLTLYARQGMPLVTEAQMMTDYAFIKQDLIKVGYAYHICELIDGLCPENQEMGLVFDLLTSTLDKLCLTTEPLKIVQAFELELLDILGFGAPSMEERPYFNIHAYIESLMEKKLKSKEIFLHTS